MTMMLLKRQNVPLDRDVILLAESGEEGASQARHRLHDGRALPGDRRRVLHRRGRRHDSRGRAKCATPPCRSPRRSCAGWSWSPRGISGHGSVPLQSNAIAHLGNAVGKFSDLAAGHQASTRPPAPTSAGSAMLASPEQAKYYRDVMSADPKVAEAAADWLFEHEPRHASMVRTSVSPNIFTGGYRSNVIPSEAKARLDVRMVPGRGCRRRCSRRSRRRSTIRRSTCSSRAAARSARRSPATRLDSELFTGVEAAVRRSTRCRRCRR